ncbi:MAG: hypothetical protein ACI4KD_05970 [Oscillospiraceae bacterium]
MKFKIDKSKLIQRIIETVVVWSLTIWLFIVCKDLAEYERGYAAFGAEYFAFFLPVIWYMIPEPKKKKEPAPSANGTSSQKTTTSKLYHKNEKVSSNGSEQEDRA